MVIPDTNAIVGNPDPADFRTLAGGGSFTFLLLPTVLSELDQLKNNHRNEAFREKVKKVITRIKGWGKQGSLLEGVTVNKNITVKAVANDPKMEHALSWLDSEIMDDRIVASVMEIQAAMPTADVMLVTGDINLLNKAQAAKIQIGEI